MKIYVLELYSIIDMYEAKMVEYIVFGNRKDAYAKALTFYDEESIYDGKVDSFHGNIPEAQSDCAIIRVHEI